MLGWSVLTLVLFVSLSSALQLSISDTVFINEPANVTWTVDPNKVVSFHLYLKQDASPFTFFSIGDVEGGGSSTGDRPFIVPNGTSLGPYHIAAYWTNDPGVPSWDTNESGTSNPFTLGPQQPPPPPPTASTQTLTQTVTTTSSGSAITSVITQVTTASSNTTSSTQAISTTVTSTSNNTQTSTSSSADSTSSPPTSTVGSSSVSQSTTDTQGAALVSSSVVAATSSSKPQTNIIVGSVIGAIVGTVLLMLIIALLRRRYREHRYHKSVAFYRDKMVLPSEMPYKTFQSEEDILARDDDGDTVVNGKDRFSYFPHESYRDRETI